jgi:3-oxoacyl-(acyl-carrier-protein) synthase
MKMALKDTKLSDIDVIVMHAPGTIKGDLTEYKAIQKLFGESLPLLTTNKWKIGHTFGASGMLSLELAILMMQHNTFIMCLCESTKTFKADKKSISKCSRFRW